jgi:hypothetical protein
MAMCMRDAIEAGDRAGALAAATSLAPFMHARLSSNELRIKTDFEAMTDQQLLEQSKELRAKIATARALAPRMFTIEATIAEGEQVSYETIFPDPAV